MKQINTTPIITSAEVTAALASFTQFSRADLPNSLIFIHFKTTGPSPEFDQIVEIAAIRTNRHLEIEDTNRDVFSKRCNVLPWVIPFPEMMVANYPSFQDVLPQTFFSMMDELVAHLRRMQFREDGNDALYVGFDASSLYQNFLRSALRQALHDPNLTYRGGALQADIVTMIHTTTMLKPEAIIVPVVNGPDGTSRRSFTIAELCQANNIEICRSLSWDAMTVAKASLELFRLLRDRAPDALSSMLHNASPTQVSLDAMANWLGVASVDTGACMLHLKNGPANTRLVPMVLGSAPGVMPSMTPVIPIGPIASDINTLIALDLRVAPVTYLSLDADGLRTLAASTKNPFVEIRIDRQPLLMPLQLNNQNLPPVFQPLLESLTDNRSITAKEADAILGDRMQMIVDHELRHPGTIAGMLTVMDEIVSTRLSTSLADQSHCSENATTPADDLLRDRMHFMSPAQQVSHIPVFANRTLKEFALRRAFVEHPEELPLVERQRMIDDLKKRLTASDEVPWRTFDKAFQEIGRLKDQCLSSTQALAQDDNGAPTDDASIVTDHRRLTMIETYLRKMQRQTIGY